MSELGSELVPLLAPRRSKKFLVLDIESKSGASQRAGFDRPFMVGVYDGETYAPFFDTTRGGNWRERYFWEGGCVDRAMRYILRKKYRGWNVYAHNAGRFDYLFLLPWLMKGGRDLGFLFDVIPVSSAIQVLDVWHSVKVTEIEQARPHFLWRFLDSYKLIPTSLDKAARAFRTHELGDVPEGKLSIDLNLHENDRQWVEYNRVDCVQLYAVLKQFHHYIENVLLGEVGITAPATSMKLYRRRYLKKPIPRSSDTHEFVRSSYCGGRVEVFQTSESGLRYYDINSSYPAAMLKPMPAGPAIWHEGKPLKRFERDGYVGFCECDVKVPADIEIPPLPVRATREMPPSDGKLIFPVGRLRGVWEADELQMAVDAGCEIVRYHRSVWYRGEELFAEYVRELYPYRNKDRVDYDPGLAEVVKVVLNALYGKFATKRMRRRIYLYDDPNLPKDAVPACSEPDSLVWYAEQDVDATYIIPQISARITALGRINLYRVMQQVIRLGGKLCYCDTDSVITDVKLSTSSELGALKDEYPEHSGKLIGHFLGPKLYILTSQKGGFERIKAKGLQKRTRENVEALSRGETIFMNRLEKVGAMARSGFQRGPRMIYVPRTIRHDVGKRIVLEDGNTRPWNVRMW